jgi:NAD(P)-dependent dehydrogenase (short-subunit alcohol dehydrogenase family)
VTAMIPEPGSGESRGSQEKEAARGKGRASMPEKIAVLTGAGRGLGRSMALHLAAQGVGIAGTYLSNKDAADEVAAEIEKAGSQAVMLPLDAARTDTFGDFAAALAAALQGTFGRGNFDFLINNAGIGLNVPYTQTTEQQFDEVVQIQLKAPFFLTQRLLPLMVDGGRILNVSSGLARFTLPGNSAYAATKGAIEVLTRYQAKELGERNIRVNVVAPGAIETDFAGGRVRDSAEINGAIAATIPLGRVGLPDDVGAAVAGLLSDAFSWVNGARIEVSGGQNL